MRAFIIRPFGMRNDIDFDAVEKLLISPALEQLGISGRTTIEILRAGNIRIDMFQRLLTADIVIADISIHNANVFYELGIRHALCDKRTFMIRCDTDKYPFDLQTDRYFTYDKGNPAASLERLVDALRQTMDSEDQDSPIFKLLPNLQIQDRSRFLPVPLDFQEEAKRAVANKQLSDLELLAAEIPGFEWESEGFRMIGHSQFDLKAFKSARTTWEAVRSLNPMDLEANTMLGTIYQRLGDLTGSDQALNRAIIRKELNVRERAELYSLLGRNAKTRWKAEWERDQVPLDQRRETALRSPHLEESYEAYLRGFQEDLNHFYSGLNALAMLSILVELAQALPKVWAEHFVSDEECQRELISCKEQIMKLSAGIELSLKAQKDRLTQEVNSDIWVEIGEADLCLLTSKRPHQVTSKYRDALTHAQDFAVDSVRNQLAIYLQLGVLEENANAAYNVVAPSTADGASDKEKGEKHKRILVFTGHMIDAPNREKPRFPPDQENVAIQKIKKVVTEELMLPDGMAYGIAGGACGGDILFHEVCAELSIPTQLYLAIPRDKYVSTSVAPAGPRWIERFNELYKRLPKHVLAESGELPRWLREKPNYSIWQRNNLWMLYNALAAGGGEKVTLIALWNGEKGDGPGGTEDLVQKAREHGAKTLILNTKELFGV
jgi:tetratricopeptide repeat protein